MVCIPLKAVGVMVWATAIFNGAATKFYPPESPEFWVLKEKYKPSRRPHPRCRLAEKSTHPLHNFVVQLNDRHVSKCPPETPQRTRGQFFDSCRVREFTPQQYNSDGLLAYLQFLRDKYNDDVYLDVYGILSEQRVGIDIFKSATVCDASAKDLLKELKEDLGLKVGVARRLVEKFQAWHNTLPPL